MFQVVDLTSPSTSGVHYPELPRDVPLLSTLAPKVSPFMVNNCTEVVYSYCYSLRVYHGDWAVDTTGFLGLVMSITKVLHPRLTPTSSPHAGAHPGQLLRASANSWPVNVTDETVTSACPTASGFQAYEQLADVWSWVLDSRFA